MPLQISFLTHEVIGSEDCLYLNVFAKKLQSAEPLPVMVYLYGGAFKTGEATRTIYAPDYFMIKDVILVTLNYRLGALGFLSLKDRSLQVPGNAGLKDQILALKWVKQYISYFNGDSNNITLFGNSSGSCCTHYMMSTKQTRGLFHKAIPMSGDMLSFWSDTPQADRGYRLAQRTGYKGDNIDNQVFDHLHKLPPQQLIGHSLLTEAERHKDHCFDFAPTIETYVGEDCVIPKPPEQMVREAWSHDIPVMLGGTSFEDEQTKKYPQKLIETHFIDNDTHYKKIINFLDYYSFTMFWHGTFRSLNARLNYATAPTYFYRFAYDSPEFNLYRKKFCGDYIKQGVCHADDLSYIFGSFRGWKLDRASNEFRTIQRMIGIFTAFARNSSPNCPEIKHLNWQPAQRSQPQRVVNISDYVGIIALPEYSKLMVWESMYNISSL
ncbi:alpha-Est5 [Drosophila busckii]|uniref:carboxylesterase n=1 Tax=Drosophila busckii TaxID=30019 RepID=A0A0M3QTX8_DROBS|nr:alpha-Est5 [Drosophila busckii]